VLVLLEIKRLRH